MQSRSYSPEGLALTMQHEGLRLKAYQDSAGVWTIGYGHTGPEVHDGQVISEFEAEAMLRADLALSVRCVNRYVERDLTQRQFDALVDFCFNVGRGAFLASSLLRYCNQGTDYAVERQFGNWIFAGGVRVPGLIKRRNAEAAMYAGKPAPAV